AEDLFVTSPRHVAGRTVERDHFGWDANGHGVIREVLGNHGVGTDGDVVTDVHFADDLDARAYVYVVAERRYALTRASVGESKRHALREVAVATDHAVGVDEHAREMTYVEPRADVYLYRDAYAQATTVAPQEQVRQRIDEVAKRAM